MSHTQWSLDPLLYATLPNEVCESIFADIIILRFMFLLALLLSTTYSITHKVLLKMSREYNAIESAKKRIVVIHHAVEGMVISVVFPFFSYYMIKTNFQVHEFDEFSSNVQAIIICSINFIMMYMFELASRFEEPRPIIVFHHVLACLDGLLVLFFPTTIIIKTVSVLLYFICFEALTFVGLFMYRIFPNSTMTPHVMLAGMVSFGITRPLQVLWILAPVIGSWNDEHVAKWQGILQVIVTCILTMIQIFTLKIHYGIWKRCISRQKQGTNISIEVMSSSKNRRQEKKKEEQSCTCMKVTTLGEDSECFKIVDYDFDEEKSETTNDDHQ